MAMKVLTADDLLKMPVEIEPVETGDDEGVYVKVMLGEDIEKFQAEVSKDTSKAMSLLVWLCACDEEGNRLFAGHNLDHIRKMPQSVLVPIANKASEINRLGGDDAIEEAAGNS